MYSKIWRKENILTFIEIPILIMGISYCFLNQTYIAVICLILLGICDGFDGTVARKLRKDPSGQEYGVQLDSLADIMTCGILPVLICFSMGFNGVFDIIIYALFIICGITRLSYYNVNNKDDKSHFCGLPITVSTMVISCLYAVTKNEIVYMISLCILSILYVTNIKIKKPNTIIKVLMAIIGLVVAITVLLRGINI